MYLISVYFDEKTSRRIQRYIDLAAEKTGNHFMIEGQVPPHMTISAFETRKEEAALEALECVSKRLKKGTVTWASVGQFFPYVLFLQPVLNEYLHNMAEVVSDELKGVDDIKISPFYQPFQWIPHVTIGKMLSKEEMQVAFEVLQSHFGVFEGAVVRIGLARTNPHRDIKTFTLSEED